jgi:hypothetical protein
MIRDSEVMLKDSKVLLRISEAMMRDSDMMKTIAVVTVLFLPSATLGVSHMF